MEFSKAQTDVTTASLPPFPADIARADLSLSGPATMLLSGDSFGSQFNSEAVVDHTAVIGSSDSAQTSWAVYSFTDLPLAFEPQSILVRTLTAPGPGPQAWIAIADYSSQRWELEPLKDHNLNLFSLAEHEGLQPLSPGRSLHIALLAPAGRQLQVSSLELTLRLAGEKLNITTSRGTYIAAIQLKWQAPSAIEVNGAAANLLYAVERSLSPDAPDSDWTTVALFPAKQAPEYRDLSLPFQDTDPAHHYFYRLRLARGKERAPAGPVAEGWAGSRYVTNVHFESPNDSPLTSSKWILVWDTEPGFDYEVQYRDENSRHGSSAWKDAAELGPIKLGRLDPDSKGIRLIEKVKDGQFFFRIRYVRQSTGVASAYWSRSTPVSVLPRYEPSVSDMEFSDKIAVRWQVPDIDCETEIWRQNPNTAVFPLFILYDVIDAAKGEYFDRKVEDDQSRAYKIRFRRDGFYGDYYGVDYGYLSRPGIKSMSVPDTFQVFTADGRPAIAYKAQGRLGVRLAKTAAPSGAADFIDCGFPAAYPGYTNGYDACFSSEAGRLACAFQIEANHLGFARALNTEPTEPSDWAIHRLPGEFGNWNARFYMTTELFYLDGKPVVIYMTSATKSILFYQSLTEEPDGPEDWTVHTVLSDGIEPAESGRQLQTTVYRGRPVISYHPQLGTDVTLAIAGSPTPQAAGDWVVTHPIFENPPRGRYSVALAADDNYLFLGRKDDVDQIWLSRSAADFPVDQDWSSWCAGKAGSWGQFNYQTFGGWICVKNGKAIVPVLDWDKHIFMLKECTPDDTSPALSPLKTLELIEETKLQHWYWGAKCIPTDTGIFTLWGEAKLRFHNSEL